MAANHRQPYRQLLCLLAFGVAVFYASLLTTNLFADHKSVILTLENTTIPLALNASFIQKSTASRTRNGTQLHTRPFHMNLLDFKLNYSMTSAPVDCRNLTLFVGIMSTDDAEAKQNRDALRSIVFNKAKSLGVLHRFFIANRTAATRANLAPEMREHDDLVYMDWQDSYMNNTIKWNAIYQWHQAFCNSSTYFMKLDSDVVIHFSRLFQWLGTRFGGVLGELKDWIVCQKISDVGPIRQKASKWYVSESQYSGAVYPTYCAGYAVIMPSGTVAKLLAEAKNHKFLRIDDVFFTGLVSQPLNISVVDFEGIRDKIRPANCQTKPPTPINVHNVYTAAEVRHAFAELEMCGQLQFNRTVTMTI